MLKSTAFFHSCQYVLINAILLECPKPATSSRRRGRCGPGRRSRLGEWSERRVWRWRRGRSGPTAATAAAHAHDAAAATAKVAADASDATATDTSKPRDLLLYYYKL